MIEIVRIAVAQPTQPRHQRPGGMGRNLFHPGHFPNRSADGQRQAFPQNDLIPEKAKTERVYRPASTPPISVNVVKPEHLPGVFQPKPYSLEEGHDSPNCSVELLLVSAKEYHIIHIPDVVLNAKLILDEVVQWCQVEITEPVAS